MITVRRTLALALVHSLALGACARPPQTAEECIQRDTKGLPDAAAGAVVAGCYERFKPKAVPLEALPDPERRKVVFAELDGGTPGTAGTFDTLTIYNGSREFTVAALVIKLVREDRPESSMAIKLELIVPMAPLSTVKVNQASFRTPLDVPDGWILGISSSQGHFPEVYGTRAK